MRENRVCAVIGSERGAQAAGWCEHGTCRVRQDSREQKRGATTGGLGRGFGVLGSVEGGEWPVLGEETAVADTVGDSEGPWGTASTALKGTPARGR